MIDLGTDTCSEFRWYSKPGSKVLMIAIREVAIYTERSRVRTDDLFSVTRCASTGVILLPRSRRPRHTPLPPPLSALHLFFSYPRLFY